MTSSRRYLLCSSLAVQCLFVCAQKLTPSSSWRKPNITTPPAQRISLADDAIEKSISMLTANGVFNDSAFGTPGMLFAEMAEFDIATNQTKYQNQLTQFLKAVEAQKPDFQDEFVSSISLNYGLIYGYAAARAYTAYKDPTFLNWATDVWSFGQTFTLSSAEASSGTVGVKSFRIQSMCQGITMAGGTFWETDADDPSLNGLATGYFLVNSALLAEATSNQTYLRAAKLSANFIHSHLYNVNNVVQDTISARQNDSCATSNTVDPYNSGLMIEGLAILATLTNDSDTQSLLLNAINAAVTSQVWQGSDGIIANGGGKAGDALLLRGLVAAYTRNANNYNLRNYLKGYIGAQYNAILDQATISDSNIYGSSWVGPPATTYQSDNQTTSLMGLIGSIYLVNDTIPSNSSNSDGSGSTSSSSLAGPIAGGVLGGLALIAILAGLLFSILKRKKKERHIIDLDEEVPPDPEPFMMTQISGAGAGDTYDPYDTVTTSNTTVTGTGHLALPVPIVRREKQGLHGQNQSSETSVGTDSSMSNRPHSRSPLAHITSEHSPSQSQLSGSLSGNATTRGDELPTSELVRLLNERLQPDQWDDEEVPPEYPRTALPPR